MEKDPKIAIVYCRLRNTAEKWIMACKKKGIEYELFDISEAGFIHSIALYSPNIILTRPPGDIEMDKILYDEKCYIMSQVMKLSLFPSYNETIIYENKKMLAYYLEAKAIPHPRTLVFYSKSEASMFAKKTMYPIVVKSTIGASGTGVVICRTRGQFIAYTEKAFSNKGVPIKVGPNRNTGNVFKWLKKAIHDPHYFKERVAFYRTVSDNRPKNYVICQEFIPHNYEWRAAKIGDSYFAHKKTKIGDKCSGTKGIDYVNPPLGILNFIRNLCDENNFHSVAIDIFEHDGKYLVNEIQSIFGHVQDHILEVNGKPGRYKYLEGKWIFEEGMFNSNESYDLRMETALQLYKQGKL